MQNTTNVFLKGMTTDMHPLTISQQEYTDALNATLVTFNGNEQMMQNDMGNTKIQDSKTGNIMSLREGFIPVGLKEHGGVMYIASVNSDGDGEIGTIPSPVIEYNIGKTYHLYKPGEISNIPIKQALAQQTSGIKRSDKTYSSDTIKIEDEYSQITDAVELKDEYKAEPGTESSLIQLTTEKVHPGEKFLVILHGDTDSKTTVNIQKREGSDWKEKPIEYNTISKKDDKGLYKIQLKSKTDKNIYDLSELTEKEYDRGNGGQVEYGNEWYINLKSNNGLAKDINPDIDVLNIADNTPGSDAFLHYPSIPPGYPCINFATENIDSFQLCSNSSQGQIYPVTLFDGTDYYIGIKEFWYKTSSAVHINKLNIIVEDDNGTLLKLFVDNNTSDITSKDYTDFEIYEDGKLYKITAPDKKPDDSGKIASNFDKSSFNTDGYIAVYNIGPDWNKWYTLKVTYYGIEWTGTPLGTYELRFNQYVMDKEHQFYDLYLEPEIDYPNSNTDDGFIQQYYDIASKESTTKAENIKVLFPPDKIELKVNQTEKEWIEVSSWSKKNILAKTTEEYGVEYSYLFNSITQPPKCTVTFAVDLIRDTYDQGFIIEEHISGIEDSPHSFPIYYLLIHAVFIDGQEQSFIVESERLSSTLYNGSIDWHEYRGFYSGQSQLEWRTQECENILPFKIKGIEFVREWDKLFYGQASTSVSAPNFALHITVKSNEGNFNFLNKSDYKLAPQFNLVGIDQTQPDLGLQKMGYYFNEGNKVVCQCNLNTFYNYLKESPADMSSNYIFNSDMRIVQSIGETSIDYPETGYSIEVDNKKELLKNNVYLKPGIYYLGGNFINHGLIFTFADAKTNLRKTSIIQEWGDGSVIFLPNGGYITSIKQYRLESGEVTSNTHFQSIGLYELDQSIACDPTTNSINRFKEVKQIDIELNKNNNFVVPQIVYTYYEWKKTPYDGNKDETPIECINKTYGKYYYPVFGFQTNLVDSRHFWEYGNSSNQDQNTNTRSFTVTLPNGKSETQIYQKLCL